MAVSDTLYIDTLLKVATEQRDAALNDVCRLRADNALLQRQVGEIEEALAAAKKPKLRAKPKPKSPRVKR